MKWEKLGKHQLGLGYQWSKYFNSQHGEMGIMANDNCTFNGEENNRIDSCCTYVHKFTEQMDIIL